MTTRRTLRLSLSLAMVSCLAACGGGGSSASALSRMIAQRLGSTSTPTTTTTPPGTQVTAAPTFGATAVSETVAAADTLVLSGAGLSTVPVGTYPLTVVNTETGPVISQSMALSYGTLVVVYPENDRFDTGLVYVQEHPEKYSVGFVTNLDAGSKAYACRSKAWTQAELQELAEAANDPSLLTQPICTKAITLDASKRNVAYSDVPLLLSGDSSDQVVVSATFSWPVPEPIVFDVPATSVETAVAP